MERSHVSVFHCTTRFQVVITEVIRLKATGTGAKSRIMIFLSPLPRIKSTDSIVRKLRDRGLPFSLESIERSISDIAGVRVICSFPEDIYLLADCLLRQNDITLIERKDYIATPKDNGYRSLHLSVEVPIFLSSETRMMKVEVQLRTIAMDFWASLEHKLRYKKDLPEELSRQLEHELFECAETSAALDLRMERIKRRISDPDDNSTQKGNDNEKK